MLQKSVGSSLVDTWERPLFAAFNTSEDPVKVSSVTLKSLDKNSKNYQWQELVTPCVVSQSDVVPECRLLGYGGSCLLYSSPEEIAMKGADYDSSFYDQQTNRCYRLHTSDPSSDQTFIDYPATGHVKLEWEDFNTSESGNVSVIGYNVYRKYGTISFLETF